MKKLLCIALACITVFALCSCSLLDDVKEKVEQGFETLINQNTIEATGITTEAVTNTMKVYDDKIVISVDTANVRALMEELGVTVESIKAERKNAETAHMEYVLEYQYYVQLKINQESKIAACKIPVTEETLTHGVEITIPIEESDMSVTVYELLQGESLKVEGALYHGTDHTTTARSRYYINAAPEDIDAPVLTMEDNRTIDK